MAKQKKLSKFLKKHSRKNPEDSGIMQTIKENPLVADAMNGILPGIAGFVGTRLGAKTANALLTKFATSLVPYSTYTQTVIGLAVGLGLWYAAERFQSLHKYREGLVIGAGIAVAQLILEAFLPGMAPLLGAGQPQMMLANDHTDGYEETPEEADLLSTRVPRSLPESRVVTALSDDDVRELSSGIFASN